MGAASSFAIVALLINGALFLGLSIYFLKLIRKEEHSFDDAFSGFNHFGNALGVYFLSGLFIFLWTMLLIIPGIIKALAYSQTFYILADHPELGPLECITLSRRMMKGAKGKLFAMGFGFALLIMLAIFLTLGIGMLWLGPFIKTSRAQFYQDLKENYHTDAQI
jgi:uncharacterized membrane protein